jgi:uncharacterized Zn finger protein
MSDPKHEDVPPQTRPARKVKGGIRAQTQRGSFGGTWWGRRWLTLLEQSPIGLRLSRGRAYARNGQVMDLRITKGEVSARVQGSRRTAYKVRMRLRPWNAGQWGAVCASLAQQPILAAGLLANDMPEDLDTVFNRLGLSLFPAHKGDFATECSCPDWSNPCKHIAAVYYLLAEALDLDPFLLFRLRGMERDELIAALQGETRPAAGEERGARDGARESTTGDREPLPGDPAAFWSEAGSPPDLPPYPEAPALHAALPKRLGSLPFWRSERQFFPVMDEIYRTASEFAIQRLTNGDRDVEE